MRVYLGIESTPSPPPPTVAVMGTFDGVHRGHQALLDLGVKRAMAIGAEPWALTFDPHPSRLLGPDLAPPLLCTVERRLELIAATGVRAALVLPFDQELASTSCEDFVTRYLSPICAREVVVGYDFTFGKDRAGDASTLRDIGARHGIRVHIVPPVSIDGGMVPSSTKVRQLLLEGRVEAAAMLLGRPPELGGRVVPGEGRGRELGFPTANVEVESDCLLPANGVYAARVRLEEPKAGEEVARPRRIEWAGAANIGTNPTFTTGSTISFEVHLLDYQGESLVGRRLRVELLARLRSEQRFPSAEALVAQIRADVAEVRRVLAEAGGAGD